MARFGDCSNGVRQLLFIDADHGGLIAVRRHHCQPSRTMNITQARRNGIAQFDAALSRKRVRRQGCGRTVLHRHSDMNNITGLSLRFGQLDAGMDRRFERFHRHVVVARHCGEPRTLQREAC